MATRKTRDWNNHPLVVSIVAISGIAGIVACCIAVIFFTTGYQTIPELINDWGNPGLMENPFAEPDGIIWQASFYNNKELKEPVAFDSRIRGARNGLRVDWDVGSPNKRVNDNFYSAVFEATYNFNAATYCFVIEVDDGAKLFIDGVEVRSVWWGYTPGAVYKTPLLLEEGPHTIQFHYYEEYEKSSFHLYWYKDAGPECVTIGHPGVP